MAEAECKVKLPVTTSAEAEAAFWTTFGAEAELRSVSTMEVIFDCVCLSVYRITQSSIAVYVNPCNFMHYCCVKNRFKIWLDPTRNGPYVGP